MELLANRRFLDAPPELSITCTTLTKVELKKLNIMNKCINTAITVMNQYNKLLNEEVNTLERLFRSRECSFKKHKHFQAMQRVNKCMSRVVELDIVNIYKKIKLPMCFSTSSVKNKAEDMNLPSRQTLQYVLMRTIGLIDLFLQACDYSYLGVEYCWNRIQRGHFLSYFTVTAACLSRLWLLCAVFATDASEWYKTLRSRVKAFPKAPKRWLPEGTLLPSSKSVTDKLNSGTIATVKNSVKNEQGVANSDPLSSLASTFQSESEQSSSTPSTSKPKSGKKLALLKKEELGVVISREEFNRKRKVPKKGKQAKKKRKVN